MNELEIVRMNNLELIRALIHLNTKYEFKHKPNRDIDVYWYIDDEGDIILNYTEEKYDKNGEQIIHGLVYINKHNKKTISSDYIDSWCRFPMSKEITPLFINMCILIMKDGQITDS